MALLPVSLDVNLSFPGSCLGMPVFEALPRLVGGPRDAGCLPWATTGGRPYLEGTFMVSQTWRFVKS